MPEILDVASPLIERFIERYFTHERAKLDLAGTHAAAERDAKKLDVQMEERRLAVVEQVIASRGKESQGRLAALKWILTLVILGLVGLTWYALYLDRVDGLSAVLVPILTNVVVAATSFGGGYGYAAYTASRRAGEISSG